MTEVSTKRENPLLQKIQKIPGETFRLPSRGLFYKNGELADDVESGEVVVYPMTTLDELMMRSPDMLFQGTAIATVIQRCVPSILKPLELLSGDVDFLLTCLRKVSYGEYLPVKHACRTCEAKTGEKQTPQEYDIPISYFIRKAKEFTPEDAKKLTVNLRDIYHVTFKPVMFHELLAVYRNTSDDVQSSAESALKYIVQTMSAIIAKVDNIDDREMIEEWLKALPREMMEELTNMLSVVNDWGCEFKYTVKCKKCEASEDIYTTLNPTSFFTLPSSPKTTNE